jgi:hypothetical protein
MEDLFWRYVFTDLFFGSGGLESGHGWRTYGAKQSGSACSYVPSHVASGWGGAMPHELIHSYGYWHPGFDQGTSGCMPGPQDGTTTDTGYPYQNGSIGERYKNGQYAGKYGFDIGDANNSPQALSPSVYSDIMSYCSPIWLSDYSYTNILKTMCDEQPADCNGVVNGLSIVGDIAGHDSEELHSSGQITNEAFAQDAEEMLFVRGNINLDTDSVTLGNFILSSELETTPRPSTSPYSIELQDEQGETLAEYPFAPKELTIHEADEVIALIGEVIPYADGTQRIVIVKDGTDLASRSVSSNSPEVEVVFPNGGEVLGPENATVQWEGSDPDGDELSFYVLYSDDDGDTWRPIGADITGNEFQVNFSELPGTEDALFRVMTSDGVNTAEDSSDAAFTVEQKSPVARILSPGENSVYSTRQTVMLIGEASDAEDVYLNDDSLEWKSDIQGELGTGHSLAVTRLMPGNHTITLTATDGTGMTSEATTQIEVTEASPYVDAGPDQWVTSGSDVRLDGSRSSGFGTNATYAWKQTEGPEVNLSNPSQARSSFVAPVVEANTLLTFELTVNGTSGLNSTGLVGVTVLPKERSFSIIAEDSGQSYSITGISSGPIPNSSKINPDVSVEFILDSNAGGNMELQLPVEMIDGITAVTSNGETLTYQENTSDEFSVLTINIPQGVTEIEVLATFVVPEFGPMLSITGIAFVSIMVLLAAGRFRNLR